MQFYKIHKETFKRYDPVEIEIKSIPILDYNVTYRRGINNDTDFYIEKGPRISVIFLHGPGEQNLKCSCTCVTKYFRLAK